MLHRTNKFHLIKHKGIRQVWHNWAALHIQVEKNQDFNIITSYVKHGWEIDSLYTLNQVQDYIGTFDVPWLWGGDHNRSPEELVE